MEVIQYKGTILEMKANVMMATNLSILKANQKLESN